MIRSFMRFVWAVNLTIIALVAVLPLGVAFLALIVSALLVVGSAWIVWQFRKGWK